MSARYAWVITRDHVADDSGDDYSCVGVSGPSDAPDEFLSKLNAGKGWTFRMYDDDGLLYVTGRGYAEGEGVGEEDHVYGPLRDYGAGGLGCVEIRWHGHPEWDCG